MTTESMLTSVVLLWCYLVNHRICGVNGGVTHASLASTTLLGITIDLSHMLTTFMDQSWMTTKAIVVEGLETMIRQTQSVTGCHSK